MLVRMQCQHRIDLSVKTLCLRSHGEKQVPVSENGYSTICENERIDYSQSEVTRLNSVDSVYSNTHACLVDQSMVRANLRPAQHLSVAARDPRRSHIRS
jgi:hypothetical protein